MKSKYIVVGVKKGNEKVLSKHITRKAAGKSALKYNKKGWMCTIMK